MPRSAAPPSAAPAKKPSNPWGELGVSGDGLTVDHFLTTRLSDVTNRARRNITAHAGTDPSKPRGGSPSGRGFRGATDVARKQSGAEAKAPSASAEERAFRRQTFIQWQWRVVRLL